MRPEYQVPPLPCVVLCFQLSVRAAVVGSVAERGPRSSARKKERREEKRSKLSLCRIHEAARV